MADPIRNYLNEVGRQLRLEMPETEVEPILVETENHLRERLQALEELGIPSESAAYDAIEAFGGPRAYAKALVEVHDVNSPRCEKVLRLWIAGFALSVLFFAIFLSRFPVPVYLAISLTCLFGIGWASLRIRHLQFASLLVSAFSVGFLSWLAGGLLYWNLWEAGGLGFTTKSEATQFLKRESDFKVAAEEFGRARRIVNEFRKDASSPLATATKFGFVSGNLILAPKLQRSPWPKVLGGDYGPMARLQLEPLSQDIAVERWVTATDSMSRIQLDVEFMGRNLPAIRESRNLSLIQNLQRMVSFFWNGLGITFIGSAISHLLGLSIGRFLRRRRLRRNRSVA